MEPRSGDRFLVKVTDGGSKQFDLEKIRDVQLVFFDIDGTLIGANGKYSSRTKSEIKRIQSSGIKTAVASGRPTFAAEFIVDELGLDSAGLFCAGAMLFDPSKDIVLTRVGLESESVAKITDFAREQKMHCEIYEDDKYWVEANSDIQLAHSRALRSTASVGDFSGLLNEGLIVTKLLVGVNEVDRPGALEKMAEEFPSHHFAFARMASHPDWNFASIISGKVNKQNAFHRLCQYHGVSAEQVVAFGDAPADADFLRLAGVGVAMGNAASSLKGNADFVTLSVEEEGIAHALSLLVPV